MIDFIGIRTGRARQQISGYFVLDVSGYSIVISGGSWEACVRDQQEKNKNRVSVQAYFLPAGSLLTKSKIKELAKYKKQQIPVQLQMPMEWYDSDTINNLMDLYFRNAALEYTHAINADTEDGEVFRRNLRQREERLKEADRFTQAFTPRILIPTHINGNHWVGLIIDRPHGDINATIHYFDPMGHTMPLQLIHVLNEIYPGARFDVNTNVFQYDWYNCGPWVIEFFRNPDNFFGQFYSLGGVSYNIQAARAEQLRDIRTQQLFDNTNQGNLGEISDSLNQGIYKSILVSPVNREDEFALTAGVGQLFYNTYQNNLGYILPNAWSLSQRYYDVALPLFKRYYDMVLPLQKY
ncbi:hypothetical protein GAMM_100045 [Gammaproteobacteria bacterium]